MAWGQVLGAAAGMGGSLTELMPNYVGQGMNYLGTGLLTGNWGGTSKERKNVITDQRKLRKTAYQDMTYSLQKAGLNPILALGASPGNASAQQVATQLNQNPRADVGPSGVGSAIAANRQAGVKEKQAPSEIELRNVETQNRMLSRAGILQQYELNEANIDLVKSSATASKALALLHAADVEQKGASAAKLKKEIDMLDTYGPSNTSWSGMLRAMLDNSKDEDGNSAWDWMRYGFDRRGKPQED